MIFLKKLMSSHDGVFSSPYPSFCLLFLISSFLRPYIGIEHDSVLYALEVLNGASNGKFNSDLYFQFGTQGNYSLFSSLSIPFVTLLGIDWGFFTLFVLTRCIYVYAALQVSRLLVPSPSWAFVSAAGIVLFPIPYGPFEIFHSSEGFLTPRLMAEGISLLAIGYFFQAQGAKSLLCAGLALLLHPIMGFPVVLTVLFGLCGRIYGWTRSLYGLAIVFPVFLLSLSLLDLHSLLGIYDAQWQRLVYQFTSYNHYWTWKFSDWAKVIAVFMALGAVCFCLNQKKRMLAYTLMLVGLVCWATAFVGHSQAYLLIVQAQLHRAMWILSVLAIPLCIQSVLVGWALPERRRFLVLTLTAAFGLYHMQSVEKLVVASLCITICWIAIRGLRKTPRISTWLESGMIATVIGFPLIVILGILVGGFTSGKPIDLSPQLAISTLFGFGASISLGFFGFILAKLFATPFLKNSKSFPLLLLLGFIVLALCQFQMLWPNRFSSSRQISQQLELRQVKEYLTEKNLDEQLEIYWPGRCNLVWLRLEQNCFFDIREAAATIFNRKLGLALWNRMLLVLSYENSQSKYWPDWLSRPISPLTHQQKLDLCKDHSRPEVLILEDNGSINIRPCTLSQS